MKATRYRSGPGSHRLPGRRARTRFSFHGTIAAGSGPSAIVAGDFTGDGVLDLAVADSNSGAGLHPPEQRQRDVLRPRDLPCRQLAPRWWRATSATATSTWPSPTPTRDDVSVLLGNGDGTFQPQRHDSGPASDPRRRSWRPISTATAASTWPPANVRLGRHLRCSWATATARSRTSRQRRGRCPSAPSTGRFQRRRPYSTSSVANQYSE